MAPRAPAYPGASGESLRLASDWTTRFFLLDDLVEERGADLEAISALNARYLAVLGGEAPGEPSVGFGLELALETNEPLGEVEKSWPLLLLERVGNELAEHESVREKVKAGFLKGRAEVSHSKTSPPPGPDAEPWEAREVDAGDLTEPGGSLAGVAQVRW